jgi:hypothetical protein
MRPNLFLITQNSIRPEIKHDKKKEPDLARPDPRQPETQDYPISDDLKPDPTRTRMTQNLRWPELIRTRNLARLKMTRDPKKPDSVQLETRPDPTESTRTRPVTRDP